jgi:divinyl protochlorophyllide a 8-vinyl-reductase
MPGPSRAPAAIIEIGANPIATPGCPWHRGVFQVLFRSLVSPGAAIAKTGCCALGDAACRFEIRY